jgi:membrane protein
MCLRPAAQRGAAVFDRLCERFPWLRTPLAVHQRVSDVGGGPLSSSIALAGFLSLFPLLLLGISVVGFVASGQTDFADRVVESLGLTGRAAQEVLDVIDKAEQSRRTASVIGLIGLLWGGLGIVGTLEQAMDATWQVKGPGVITKLIGLVWLVGAGALFLLSMSLGPAVAQLPGPATVPTVILGLGLDIVLFLWMFRTLTHVPLPWTAHLPGAIVGGVGLELLKLIGTVYVPRAVASASALYGSLGTVFAILAWLALAARLVLYAAAFNVVRWEREHGTVTVGIEVPRIEGEVPLEATRGGAVSETAPEPHPS